MEILKKNYIDAIYEDSYVNVYYYFINVFLKLNNIKVYISRQTTTKDLKVAIQSSPAKTKNSLSNFFLHNLLSINKKK